MIPRPFTADPVIMLTVHCEGVLTGHGVEISSAAIVGEEGLIPVDFAKMRVSDRLILEYRTLQDGRTMEIKP